MSYIEDKLTNRKIKISCIAIFDEEDALDCSSSLAEFDSIKDLTARYKDYEPKLPLIKDEKVRKAVRAWAEVNSIEGVIYDERLSASSCTLIDAGDGFYDIELVGCIPTLKDGDTYTIAELCGEEVE